MENECNWLEMIRCKDGDVGRLMHALGPMDIKGVSKKPVVFASENFGEHLVHGPGCACVALYSKIEMTRQLKSRIFKWLDIAVDFQIPFNLLIVVDNAAALARNRSYYWAEKFPDTWSPGPSSSALIQKISET